MIANYREPLYVKTCNLKVRMCVCHIQYVCMSHTVCVYVTYSVCVCHIQCVCMSHT